MVDVVAKILLSTLEMSPKPLVRQTEDTLRIQPIRTDADAGVSVKLASSYVLSPANSLPRGMTSPANSQFSANCWRETLCYLGRLNPRFGGKPGSL
jgi:hypothetical protein